MEQGQPILELTGITKAYASKRGVRDLTMKLEKGDVYGFFGPNGAGKTTVMKIATGLCRADSGEARLFGYDVQERHEQALERVGVLIEKAEAYEYMSAYTNLELAARFYPNLPKSRIDEVLELVGLGGNRREKVGHFSLGMKQRLGIAAAMLSKPELLILDEPTNGLDIEGMVQMRELFAQLAREQGITLLISSHLITEMEMICSRIGIIHDGRLVQECSMEELRSSQTSLEAYYVSQLRAQKERFVS